MTCLRTSLCELFGIDYPIVQAPIGSGTCPALAAAVSEAGGLGTLAVTWRSVEEARTAIRETRSRTDRAFGVNVVLDPAAKETPTEAHLDACLDEGVDIVSLSFGDPTSYVDRIHGAGALLTVSVGSAAAARAAVEAGADVVVAQGWEAGGHVDSEVAILPLIPRVVDAVASADAEDVPVVAAGGIADGRGVAAVLSLGAAGAWLGTRFVASEETALHETYKRRVLAAAETETLYSELFDGGWPGTPHRVLETETTEDWERAGRPERGERPGEGEAVAEFENSQPVKRYDDVLPLPGMTGDLDALALYAGQSAGLLDDLDPADEIVGSLVAETVDAIEKTAALV